MKSNAICLILLFLSAFSSHSVTASTIKNPKLPIAKPQPKKCLDCVEYDIATQPNCLEVTRDADRDLRWASGLNGYIDQTILGGRIIAYKVRWQRGNWSEWYVPGVNDLDWKFNTENKTQRRAWAYFYSHEHHLILCK